MAAPSIFVFNEAYYLAQNPDVASAVRAGLFKSGLSHWQAYGAAEGRVASQFFDWQVYRDNNPDLAAAGITSRAALEQHFKTFGINEGRIASPLIDGTSYVNQQADLAALLNAGGNIGGFTNSDAAGTYHYYHFGINEGRHLGGARSVDPAPTADQTQPITVSDGNAGGVTTQAMSFT